MIRTGKLFCTILCLLITGTVASWSATIYIDKEHTQVMVCEGTKTLAVYPCALGKNLGQKQKKGDCRTPEGKFKIIQIQNASYWTHDFGDGKGQIKGAYGPYFLRLSTPWNGIGIHGTHDPSSMNKRVTEGCIRLTNDNLKKFVALVKVGDLVIISSDHPK